jgi:uncharacterized protein YjlB
MTNKRRLNKLDSQAEQIQIKEDKRFPNSKLPVLLYKGVLDIPFLFPAAYVKKLFKSNNWTNAWEGDIFIYHHYHSSTHEVLGIFKGKTTLLLGGDKGVKITIEKGDVLVIPAGVAHKNIGKQGNVLCVGAYPGGMECDMNYGKAGERPQADKNISVVALPETDPVSGKTGGLTEIWML